MGIVKRQFFKASAATYLGVALGYLNVTILFPYFCTPEQLGLYRVIINMATMFAAIAYMGTPQAIVKQFPKFKKKGQTNEFYGLLVLMFLSTLALSLGLLFFLEDIVIEFFSDKSPEVGEYYFYSVFIAFTLTIYVLFISNVRIIRRVAFPAFIKDVFLRILILGDILLLGFEFIDFREFIVVLCSAYMIIAIIAVIYSYRLVPFSISFNVNKLEKLDIKDTLNFSLLTFLSSVSNIIIMNADSLMITALAKDGLTDTGIYTIAFFIGSALEIPRRIIMLVTAPVISEYWTDGEMEKINDAYRQGAINSLIIGCFIFGGIWLNLEMIYQLIPNSEIYIAGINVVFFILIARLFELMCSIAPNILTQTKLYIYNLPLALLLVGLTVLTNYLLIPEYGILGAGVATMISVLIYNGLRVLLVWYFFKFPPFSWKEFRFLIVFIVLLAVNYLTPLENNQYFLLILKNFVFAGTLFSFALIDRTSKEFLEYVNKFSSLALNILWKRK